jgi:hypothetical protein
MNSLVIGIPEPNSLAVFILGAAALLWRRRKTCHLCHRHAVPITAEA